MLSSHIVCGEDRDEAGGRRGLFYVGTAVRFLALNQAHRSYYFEAKFLRCLYRLHGGGAGGAYVVHDHYPRAFFAEAFYALTGAVFFLGFADEETVQRSANYGNRHDDGISAHGKSSDGVGVPPLLADFLEKDLAYELRAASIECGSAAVDVIVAGATGG